MKIPANQQLPSDLGLLIAKSIADDLVIFQATCDNFGWNDLSDRLSHCVKKINSLLELH